MNKPHGGHGMTVAVSHVVLGHEDIMVLPTRTVTIVEAPGEGKMVCPVAALFEADTVAGAYGSVGPGQILLSLGTDRSGAWWDFADGSSSRDLFVEARKSVQLSGCFVRAQPVGDVSEAENLPVVMGFGPDATNFTGGDRANSLKVTFWWFNVELNEQPAASWQRYLKFCRRGQ